MGSYLLNSGLPFESAKAMAPGELQVQRAIGQEVAAGHRPGLRSGIQLGEASSRLPEGLVQLLWVSEEGHHQGVGHREPTQPLLFVATQRLREHQVQMLKKCEDGLVIHHEAACLRRHHHRWIERFQRFGCYSRIGATLQSWQAYSGRRVALQVPVGTERHRLQDESPYQPSQGVRI